MARFSSRANCCSGDKDPGRPPGTGPPAAAPKGAGDAARECPPPPVFSDAGSAAAERPEDSTPDSVETTLSVSWEVYRRGAPPSRWAGGPPP
eukprot:scaffold23444_cov67-Isochrysis_galbana.AAC.1